MASNNNNQTIQFGDFEPVQVSSPLTLSEIEDFGWLDEEKGQWEEFTPAAIQPVPVTSLHWTHPVTRAPGATIGERVRNHSNRRAHRSYRQEMIGFYNFRGIPLTANDVCFCDYCWDATRTMLRRN